MPNLLKRLGYYPAIIWAVILAILMLLPQDSFPESKLLSYDKLAHVGVFAILSFLVLMGILGKKGKHTRKQQIIALTISIVYGSLLEYLQTYMPGRMTDLYDFIANCTGGVVGVIIFSIFTRQKFVINKLKF